MADKHYYDLLPCPFCGGRGYLEKSTRNFFAGKSEKVALVRCLSCNARSGKVQLSKYGATSHSREAEREAVDNWNNRVTPQN